MCVFNLGQETLRFDDALLATARTAGLGLRGWTHFSPAGLNLGPLAAWFGRFDLVARPSARSAQLFNGASGAARKTASHFSCRAPAPQSAPSAAADSYAARMAGQPLRTPHSRQGRGRCFAAFQHRGDGLFQGRQCSGPGMAGAWPPQDGGGGLGENAGMGVMGQGGEAISCLAITAMAMRSPQAGLAAVAVASGRGSRPAPAASAASRSKSFL